MSSLDPANTTLGDLCTEALRECGAWGVGQTPLAEDINAAWTRLQWMLQQWENKRWLVYHLVDLAKVSTGASVYTIGPGQDFNTGASSVRPDRLEAAYLRQLVASQPNQVDYPMQIIESYEDFSRISLKTLQSFPGAVFMDTDWPSGKIHPWPVPQSTIYEIHLIVRGQLPFAFASLATKFVIPYVYYSAMLYNLALRLRPKYGIATAQGDQLTGLAKDSLNTIRGSNAQIGRLQVPAELSRSGIYNFFSDRSY